MSMPSAPDPVPAAVASGQGAPLALKIDIDTDHGCKNGLPTLLRILQRQRLRASFFLTLGPDNMGRSIWRVFTEPGFLKTVRRRGGAGAYGWSILFKGFLWPGPILWKKHGDLLKSIAAEGHEIGVHAWDHHRWQQHAPQLTADQVREIWRRMVDAYQTLFGRLPTSAAAPGWRCAAPMLALADELKLAYQSDVRAAAGTSPFIPRMQGVTYATPQLPTTLPTLDELVGSGAVPPEQLNDTLYRHLRIDGYNCHTIHAEIEGLRYAEVFEAWLRGVRERGYAVQSLSQVLAGMDTTRLPVREVVDEVLAGRSVPVSTVRAEPAVGN